MGWTCLCTHCSMRAPLWAINSYSIILSILFVKKYWIEVSTFVRSMIVCITWCLLALYIVRCMPCLLSIVFWSVEQHGRSDSFDVVLRVSPFFCYLTNTTVLWMSRALNFVCIRLINTCLYSDPWILLYFFLLTVWNSCLQLPRMYVRGFYLIYNLCTYFDLLCCLKLLMFHSECIPTPFPSVPWNTYLIVLHSHDFVCLLAKRLKLKY